MTTNTTTELKVLHGHTTQIETFWWHFVYDDHGWEFSTPIDNPATTRELAVQALKDAAFWCGYTHLDLQDEYGMPGQMIPLSMTPLLQEWFEGYLADPENQAAIRAQLILSTVN